MAARLPERSAKVASRRAPARRGVRFRLGVPKRRWVRLLLLFGGIPAALGLMAIVYFWVSYGRMIDARLGDGEQRPIPRLFARPFELQPGRALDATRLVQRLNDVGYAERPKAALPGEFSISPGSVLLVTRGQEKAPSRTVKVDFTSGPSPVIRKLSDGAGKSIDRLSLEAPLLTALAPGEKRRFVPLASIPEYVRQAVLAIEDQRFYEHPGVDPIRAVGAAISNLRGNKKYLEGASTITQQIIKNTFLTPDQTYRRKIQEQFMALVLDSRFTKDQIFELYLNEVTLGQRGPFAIHGVGEASRIFFGKDVSNLSLAEAATLAGLIQQPSALNPFRNPERAQVRRNVVLAEMAKAQLITEEAAEKASGEPIKVQTRALENEAPYFVDYVSKVVDEDFGGLVSKGGATDVYTTLDLHLQRMAQEAVAKGLVAIDKQLSKKKQGRAQVALISVDPRTGEILALVGGRGYNETQYNRALTARRQPGSIFKPFVYLAAFDKMAGGRHERPHARHGHGGRADGVQGRRQGLRAGELQGRVRRSDDAPPRACALEERRHDQSRGSRPATTVWHSSGGRSAWARPRRRSRRLRSACSKPLRSKSPRRTRSSPTTARSVTCARLPASSTTGSPQTCR